MEHKWLGFGLLAMGLVGLFSVMSESVPATAEGGAAEAGNLVKTLPEAVRSGGAGLFVALSARSSDRGFSRESLSDEQLSQLLWAACGVNRPSGRLTIPTALNVQDVRVYVFDGEGIWLYDAANHSLVLRSAGDHRAATGRQAFVDNAAANFVYAVDTSLQAARGVPMEAIVRNAAFEAGCAAQDVALVCAAEGLKNVVRGSWPDDELRTLLELPESVLVLMAQSVGP